MIKNLDQIIKDPYAAVGNFRAGDCEIDLITELAEELSDTREALAQALYSLSRATMNDGRKGYDEIDWLESHKWWPK